jgi:hypothetical protein
LVVYCQFSIADSPCESNGVDYELPSGFVVVMKEGVTWFRQGCGRL